MELPTGTSGSCGSRENIYVLQSTRVAAFCHLLTRCGNGSSWAFLQKGSVVLIARPAWAEPSAKIKPRVNSALGMLTGEQHVLDPWFLSIIPSLPNSLSTFCFIPAESRNEGEITRLTCKTKPWLLPLLYFQFIYFPSVFITP